MNPNTHHDGYDYLLVKCDCCGEQVPFDTISTVNNISVCSVCYMDFVTKNKPLVKSKTNIKDTRRVTLENSKNYIPLYSGRPSRNEPISQEDIDDLIITLNTIKDIKEICV